MKEMILVRHAKSSWENRGLRDIDRPLASRGERDAPVMGERLADAQAQVDRLVTSPAERTVMTAEAIAYQLEFDWDLVQFEDALYGASTTDWLEVVTGQDDHLQTVLFVGHNPGITDFLNAFLNEPVPNVPTCGVAWLSFEVDRWMDLETVDPIRARFSTPKNPGWIDLL